MKCRLGSVDQLVVVLKKLTYGALLSPSEASEEFREGIIKCFRELLLNLLPCSDESCACKQIFGVLMLLDYRDMKAPLSRTSKYDSEPDESLLAFLQSQTASAAVGHWLSLLLKAADNEAARGHLGSVNLRIEAFMTLCVLVDKAIGRYLCLVSNVVQICGGGFFSQRFRTDGSHFWKLLSTSSFHRTRNLKEERIPLQLPYRSTSSSSEESMAETSNLKVQVAVLNMIAELSRNGRSVSALEVVLKKVTGLVAGIACSGVVGLRDASVNALEGLASIDADLIWLLADVYYSMKNNNMPSPPTSDIPEISEIVPRPCVSERVPLRAVWRAELWFGYGLKFCRNRFQETAVSGFY